MNSKIIFLCIRILQILLLEYFNKRNFSGLDQEHEIILIDEVNLKMWNHLFKKEQLKFCPLVVFKRNIQHSQ